VFFFLSLSGAFLLPIDILVAVFFGILIVIEVALINPYKLRVSLRRLSVGVKSPASSSFLLFLRAAAAFRFLFRFTGEVIRVLSVLDILPA
jgi:hypothetical protein